MFPIFCTICDHEEQSLDDLCLHISIKHDNKKNFGNVKSSSNMDNNFFNSKSSQLKKNLKFVKEVDVEKENLFCHKCSNRKFSSNSSLLRHIRIAHLKLNKFACNECDKVFPEQGKLNQHLRKSHKLVPEILTHEVDDDLVLEVSTDFASIEDDLEGQQHVKAVVQAPMATKMFPIFNQKQKGKKLPIGCGVRTSPGKLPTTRSIPFNDEVSIIFSGKDLTKKPEQKLNKAPALSEVPPPSVSPSVPFTIQQATSIISPQTKVFINKFLAKEQAKMYNLHSPKSSHRDVIKGI